MQAFLVFCFFSILWLLYLLYAPASLNPAPPAPARPAAQVVAGRVTGTQARPPAGSRAWWREWISLSKFRMHFKMQLMPIWELLHVLMRVLLGPLDRESFLLFLAILLPVLGGMAHRDSGGAGTRILCLSSSLVCEPEERPRRRRGGGCRPQRARRDGRLR